MDDPIKESTQEQPQDLSWYQNQVGKVLNFFTTAAVTEAPAPAAVTEAPAPAAVTETPAPAAVTETPAPVAVTETPAPVAATETPARTVKISEATSDITSFSVAKPPTLPAVGSADSSDEFSRDEFLRLYRSKPNEFSAKYASKYPAQVAKQLAQSISFE